MTADEQVRRNPDSHVDSSETRSLLAGQMSAEDRETLLQHVAHCRDCRQRLQEAGVDEATMSGAELRSRETQSGQGGAGHTGDTTTTDLRPPSSEYSFLAPPQVPDEIGRLGSYRILRVLGEGGMGVVFVAEDPQLQRRVAIKVLRHGLDSTTRKRFLQEAQLAASLHSERIVTIHHIGEDRGCPYMVMELLQGESLDSRLRRLQHLPLPEALRVAREAAEGLAVAHAKGLIHRDIKPANVWLERREGDTGDFRVKLLDFGIARPMTSDSHLTEEGMIVGTPSYMCPEQAHGAPLDARSDLFSLGCLLYAMLAGDSPFARPSTVQAIRAVAEEEVAPIRRKLPHVPPPVSALLDRLLSKQPKNRPPDARSVVEELRCLELIAQPTAGLPAGLLTSLGREAALAKLTLGWKGWAGVAAVLTAIVVGSWVQYRRVLESQQPSTVAGAADSQAGSASTAGGGDKPAGAANPATGNPATTGPAAVAPAVAATPVRVGILLSFSGPMATSERPIADALLLAIDEVNAAGGVLGGRPIEPVIRDGRSYPDGFFQQAEQLISREHVVTLFGVWRSTCRKAVEQVCEAHDSLLVFPKADEGLEQSPNIIYMGGAPNQQTTEPAKWAYAFLGKRKFYLVGVEGLFSRASHEIIKDQLKVLGATLAGESFAGIGDAEYAPIAARIRESGADIVLNTVSGTGNIGLFKALHAAGLRPGTVPVISYDLTEEELRMLSERADQLAGNYASWSYFQSLPDRANQEFIQRFRKRFGPTRIVNDPMAAAYAGLHLWALGINAAGTDRPSDIRRAMVQQKFDAPEGPVAIDPATQRAIRMARIGQIGKDLEFETVWVSPKPKMPEVWPPTRTREQWEAMLKELYEEWGKQWSPDPDSALHIGLPVREVNVP